MKGRCLLLVLLPLILLAACDDGARQRLQLKELERMNRADSLMTNDSLALDLAEWFDDHGTPNEQMRAYYILGRTYADLGEAPQAIEAYNDAADRADTTDVDCDYKTLARVHAQKAEIYYNQLLPDNMIHEERYAMQYAKMAKDTMTYIYCYGMLAEGYDMKEMPDSVLQILERAYNLYITKGLDNYAAALCCSMADVYLKKGNIKKAHDALYEFETNTTFFDDERNIEQGREIYYYIRGLYYMNVSKLDSAEYYFRKELEQSLDANNIMSSYKGLQKVYEKIGNIDSLTKYAHLFMDFANTIHNDVEMQGMLRLQAAYDYSRKEKTAYQKTMEAIKFRNLFLTITVLVVVLLLLFAIFYTHYKSEKKLMESKYQNEMEKLVQAQTDLLSMRSEQHVSDKLLAQKDKEIKELQQNLETYSKKVHILQGYALNKKLQEAAITCRLKQYLKENPYQIPDYNDWKQIKMLINQEIPTFYDRLNGDGHILTDIEYDVCMLIRLQISPSDISKFKQCVPSYITQIRKTIYKKIFNIDGLAENLDKFIMSID